MLFMNTIILAVLLAASTPSQPVQTAKETVIVVKKPSAMRCGAPRALQNDEIQTVRVCEYR